MNPFDYTRATDLHQALQAAAGNPTAQWVAGGTNLLDLMKINVEQPTGLIDINLLPLRDISVGPAGLRIGALARMSDVAGHPQVRSHYPMVAEALLASASPQLRNMASMGGNLMQRTRCTYFRDTSMPCNKREPGSGCSALHGINRLHAILGVSDACIATHPSDLAVALAALDARLHLTGPDGDRVIPINDFYREPGHTPHIENVLKHGEIITALDLPASPMAVHSHYLKVRDRASFEFALTSAAIGLDLDGAHIRQARVALGGIGTRPWRAHAAERVLNGRRAEPVIFAAAARAALQGAVPHQYNAFKIELAQRTLVRALHIIAAREVTA